MKIEQIFRRLGLPKHADKIYIALQKNGALSPTDLCRLNKLHRPAVYRALLWLKNHKFIFITQNGRRKLYNAASLKIIIQEFSHESAAAAAAMKKEIISDDVYKQNELRFLSGFKGVREAFDDVISHMRRGETFYRYTSEKDLDAVNRYLSDDYRTLRDKKKLERMVISNPLSGKQKKPRLERFVKYIPSHISLFDQNIIQLVYGDRVSLIDLNTERVLIIENKQLADFQKVIFRQLYDKLPLP